MYVIDVIVTSLNISLKRWIELCSPLKHFFLKKLVLNESSALKRYTPHTMFVHFLTKLMYHYKGKGHNYFFIIRGRSFISVRLSEY